MEVINIIIPAFLSLFTGIISILIARSKSKSEIEKVTIQYKTEIEKIKMQQELELRTIKEKTQREIDKLTVEMDKQAELYLKNKQTDVIGTIFNDMMKDGSTKSFDNLIKISKEIESKKHLITSK